jgi:hypothetical protein
MRPSQGSYLHTGQHKHRINAHRHSYLEWDSNPQGISCPSPLGHSDRLHELRISYVIAQNETRKSSLVRPHGKRCCKTECWLTFKLILPKKKRLKFLTRLCLKQEISWSAKQMSPDSVSHLAAYINSFISRLVDYFVTSWLVSWWFLLIFRFVYVIQRGFNIQTLERRMDE